MSTYTVGFMGREAVFLYIKGTSLSRVYIVVCVKMWSTLRCFPRTETLSYFLTDAYANKDLRTDLTNHVCLIVLMSGWTVSFAYFYFSVPPSLWSFFLLLCFHFFANDKIGMLELKRKCACAAEMVFHLSSECEEKCQTLMFIFRINFMLYVFLFFSDPFFLSLLGARPFHCLQKTMKNGL